MTIKCPVCGKRETLRLEDYGTCQTTGAQWTPAGPRITAEPPIVPYDAGNPWPRL